MKTIAFIPLKLFFVYVALALILSLASWLRFDHLDYGKEDTESRPDDSLHVDFVLHLAAKISDQHDVKTLTIQNWGPNFIGLNLVHFLLVNYKEIHRNNKEAVEDFFNHTIAMPHQAIMGIRMMSAIFSTLSLFLIFFIAQQLFDYKSGLFAATVCAVSPLLITEAKTAKEDSLILLLMLLNILILIFYLKRRALIYFLIGGFLSGFAFGVKIIGILMLPLYTVVFLNDYLKENHKKISTQSFNKLFFKFWNFSIFFFIGYAFLNFYLLLSPISVLRTFLNMFLTFGSKADIPSNTPFLLFEVLPYGIGWLLTALAFVAVIYFLLKKNWSALSLAAVSGMLLVLLNKSPLVFDRYILFLIPAAAILAFGFVASVTVGKSIGIRIGVPALILVASAWQLVPTTLATNHLLGQPSTRKLAGDFLRSEFQEGQSVLILRYNFWLKTGPMYGLNPIKRDWFDEPGCIQSAKKHVHFDNIEFLSIDNLRDRKPDWIVVEYHSNGQISILPDKMKDAENLLLNNYEELYEVSPAQEFEKVKFNSWALPLSGFQHAQTYGPRIKIFRNKALLSNSGADSQN